MHLDHVGITRPCVNGSVQFDFKKNLAQSFQISNLVALIILVTAKCVKNMFFVPVIIVENYHLDKEVQGWQVQECDLACVENGLWNGN